MEERHFRAFSADYAKNTLEKSPLHSDDRLLFRALNMYATKSFKNPLSLFHRSPMTLPMLEPDDAVNQIVAGVLNDDVHLFVPGRLVLFVGLKAWVKSFYQALK